MSLTSKIRRSTSVALISLTLITSTATATYAKMFGRSFDSSHDYSCCDGNQLFIYHYYTNHFFFFKTGSGYDSEPIGNETAPGQCQPQCPL